MEFRKLQRRKIRASNEANLEQLSLACAKLGEYYFRHERHEDALREYKEEAKVNEALGNTLSVGVANRMIGEVYTSMGNYEKALEHQNIHLEVAVSHGNQVEEQRALATIGRTYFCKAESLGSESPEYEKCLAEAKKAYMKSLSLCERLTGIGRKQHMEMRARLLLNIGLVRECRQEVQQGIECIQKAILICKEQDLFEDLFRCYSALGMLYHRQGESRKALGSLGLALEVASRLEDKVQLSCETLLNKAEVLFSLPDFHGAKQVLIKAHKFKTPIPVDRKLIEKYLRIAIVMCKTEEELLRMQDDDLAAKKNLYEKMGDGCVAVKNYTKALEFYHKMRECSEALGETGKDLAAAYFSLSQTYKDNQQYDLALEYFEKELQLCKSNPTEACKTMLNIGEVQELNFASYDKLENTYREAHKLAVEASNVKLERTALEALTKVQRAKGHPELAEETEAKLQLLPAEEESESECSEDAEDEDINLDIGHDICLDELTDSGSENEDSQKPRQRRRPQQLRVKRNEKGETQLHVACINGNLALVKRLIEQGHPVNVRDHCGWMPLHEASNHGHRAIVEYLLDKGANINDRGGTQCGGVTPLHDAASCGNLEVVELLLDRGASIVMRTDEGETPLDCLLKWYARSETKFGPVEQAYFDELRERLRKALEKAGHQVQDLPQQQRQKPTQQRSLSRSQSKQPPERRSLRDNPDLGNLSEEEEEEEEEERSISRRRPSSPEDSSGVYREPEDTVHSRERGISAREEYCNLMKMLRKKPTVNTVPKQVPKPSAQDNLGFLDEEEVGEDWLEDDLPQNTRPMKKRKVTGLGKQRQEFMSGNTMRQTSAPNMDEQGFNTDNNSHQENQDTMDVTEDDFVIQETVSPTVETNRVTRTGSNAEQLSLFDTGFTSQRSIPSISTPHPYAASELPRAPLSIRVRIEDRLLLVPLQNPENLSIQWLAKEAAKRYYSLEGVKPTLKLLTKEGALLGEDDPLSLIVNTDEVTSMVTSWNIPALTERYAEACHNCGAVFDVHINSCLEACQATQSLHLSDLALTCNMLSPVFRSLNRQHTLHQLQLGGNLLCDEGVKLLTECLSTLSHLRELDISCCNITADGIAYFSNMFSNPATPVLQHLTTLNLSHNPLGDESMRHISIILSRLVSLSKLYLQACDLTADCCRIPTMDRLLLCLDAIEELDISYNKLGQRGLSGFLGRLNPSRLRRLNLAATWCNKSDSLAAEVALFLEKDEFEHLSLLDLTDCHLTDDDIWNLLRTLQRIPSLETLKLCCNVELSSVSLRRLIQHKPAIGNIDLVGCHGMCSNFEGTAPDLWLHESMCPTGREQQGMQSLTLSDSGPQGETEFNIVERMWRQGWESKAVVQRGPGGLLCLTVNEQ